MPTPTHRTLTARNGLAALVLHLLLGVLLARGLLREEPAPPTTPPPAPETAVATPAPRPFPAVPGSACQVAGNCVALEDHPLVLKAREACAQHQQRFTASVAGMTPFCQVHVLGNRCMTSCTLRFREVLFDAYQQRAEDVAQALRDTLGSESATTRWNAHASLGASRAWTWARGGVQLRVDASFHAIPVGSAAPNDIHVDVQQPVP